MGRLIEASVWTRILDLFYQSQKDGRESELLSTLRKKDPEIADIYKDWYKKSAAVLQATKRALEKRGKDTSSIDALLKKYE
jgi:hypothetical protein